MTQLNPPPAPESPQPYSPIPIPPTSGKAITTMVLGIVSIPTCCCYGFPSLICGILAIIFYILAKKDLATGNFSKGSENMNLAGLICGIVGVLLSVVYWILLAIGIMAHLNHWNTMHPMP